MAVEDVVAEYERVRRAIDEAPAEDERLRQPVGARLDAIGDVETPPGAVAQQRLEARQVPAAC